MLLSFLPRDWRELAQDTGALKGLRKDKAVDNLLRTLLLHLGCGHSLRETVVRARQAHLADLSDVALLKRLKKSKWLVARALCPAVRGAGSGGRPRRGVPGVGRGCDDGEGTATERVAVAPALQRGSAVADVRLLQTDGDRGTGARENRWRSSRSATATGCWPTAAIRPRRWDDVWNDHGSDGSGRRVLRRPATSPGVRGRDPGAVTPSAPPRARPRTDRSAIF